MKHFFIVACLLLTLLLGSPKVFAGGAGGGSLEVTQWANRILLYAQKASSAATMLNTQYDMIKNTILDPIANGLIAVALQAASNNILAWINGGMNGSPLIISNPEKFIKDQGMIEMRKALSAIPSDGTAGDGIFISLLKTYQNENSSLGDKIKTANKSVLPSKIQNNVCREEMLTKLAKEKAGGDPATAAVEKEYLYGYLCSGDPNTDEELAANLLDLYRQRPSLGGGDAWLEITGGNTGFKRAKLTESIAREEIEKAKKAAENELYLGIGTISDTKCLKLEEDAAGNTFCTEKGILNPAKTIQATLDKAATAGLDRLTNIMGEGSLSSILTGFLQDSLEKGLNTGLAEIKGGSSNVSITTNSSAPFKSDLAADPNKKTELTSTIMKQLDFHSTTISNLEAIDSSYLRGINTFQNKITQVRSCFSSLVSRGIVAEGDGRVSSAYAYYDDRKSRIDNTKNIIAGDAAKISTAKQLIATTAGKLNGSQSSQEISVIFNAYSKAYTDQKLPTSGTEAQREQDRLRDEGEAGNDTEGDSHLDSCAQIEQQWNTAQFNAYR
ncbi:MAG: hypothetical protein KBC21_00725 [Candidatus Pacebacteria bacterium]|nr:hypothetical protein [Candidatus Paceibacterota bacterium]